MRGVAEGEIFLGRQYSISSTVSSTYNGGTVLYLCTGKCLHAICVAGNASKPPEVSVPFKRWYTILFVLFFALFERIPAFAAVYDSRHICHIRSDDHDSVEAATKDFQSVPFGSTCRSPVVAYTDVAPFL